jgi:pyridoxine kinase
MSEPKLTLTIAGNDASGGAGIAADVNYPPLKSFGF